MNGASSSPIGATERPEGRMASAMGAELMRELTTRCKASATQTFGAKALRFKVQLAEALP